MAQPGDRSAPRNIAWLLVVVALITLTIFGIIYGCARAEQRGEMRPCDHSLSLQGAFDRGS